MLRLLELFAGVGAQRMALDRLGVAYKSVGISEISRPALRAYKQIHGDLDNLGDITRLEALPDCDMLTYSFPCQDLSIAGFRRGMDRGTGTRSGLLWEVERLLKGAGHLPDFLVMENVVQVHSPANAGAWRDWIASLSLLGYTSSWADINAADHGIPQHRERCIMISRRDGHVWVPPRPRPLRRALRDVLEEGPIDREYYIQPDRMRTLLAHLMRNRDAGRGFGMRITDPASVSRTVTARQRREENETVIPAESARVPTIDDMTATYCHKIGMIEGRYDTSRRVYATDACAPALTVWASNRTNGIKILADGGGVPYIPTAEEPKTIEEIPPEYRIRRLTPRECWRLMDMYAPDGHEYYDDLVSDDPRDGVGISPGQRVTLAGNSICVGVLAEVLRGVYAPSSPTLDRWTEDGQ